jgi:hypothetical protein
MSVVVVVVMVFLGRAADTARILGRLGVLERDI